MKYRTCVAITENNPKKLAIIVKNTLLTNIQIVKCTGHYTSWNKNK